MAVEKKEAPPPQPTSQSQSGVWPLLSALFAVLAFIASLSHHPHDVKTPTHTKHPPPTPYDASWAVTSGQNANFTVADPKLLAHRLIHFAETVFVRPGSDCETYATDVRRTHFFLHLPCSTNRLTASFK